MTKHAETVMPRSATCDLHDKSFVYLIKQPYNLEKMDKEAGRHARALLPAAGGASVLATDADAPPVTETTVSADLLHSLDVITELGVEVLREDLGVLASLPVLLPVEEPKRDLELAGVLDDSDELLDLVGGELTGALVHVDLGLLADKVGEARTETLDLGHSEDDIALALNVGIEDTQNVLKFLALHKRSPVNENVMGAEV